MRMDYRAVFFGSLAVLLSVMAVMVALPYLTYHPQATTDAINPVHDAKVSDIDLAKINNGRRLYISNGCWYCHSQFLRPQDWTGVTSYSNAGRSAEGGDYAYQSPVLLGTERVGPDLSQEGGAHPDDWHLAHFTNPRYTSMKSLMPSFSFLTAGEMDDLITYIQSLGGHSGWDRAQVQKQMKEKWKIVYEQGNVQYHNQMLNSIYKSSWANVENPMLPTIRSLNHGKLIFNTNCIGCHGPLADGHGPAAAQLNPKPFNFTEGQVQTTLSDGVLYEAILFGVPGTAMPAWGDMLTVNDIWDTTNFLRTIPGGGLTHDRGELNYKLMIPDHQPKECTIELRQDPDPNDPCYNILSGSGQ